MEERGVYVSEQCENRCTGTLGVQTMGWGTVVDVET